MDYKYKKIPRVIRRKSKYIDGANVPTEITVHRCFCGLGRIRYCHTPGFDDDYFEIKCPICKIRYHEFIDQCGDEWKVYKK